MKVKEVIKIHKKIKNDYLDEIQKIIYNDFNNKEKILEVLSNGKISFESLMVKIGSYVLDEDQADDLIELKGELADSLFLSVDLINLYRNNRIDEFKTRYFKYIKK